MSFYTEAIGSSNYGIAFPAGSVAAYLGNSDPDGWVIANGVARSYSNIYTNLINMGIGTGSASNYTPPNFKGSLLRGIGNGVSTLYSGPSNVAKTISSSTMQVDNIKSHFHGVNETAHKHGVYNFDGHQGANINSVWDGPNHTSTVGYGASNVTNYLTSNTLSNVTTTNTNASNETTPYNVGVNWIIKL
jgi:hypothetical protein